MKNKSRFSSLAAAALGTAILGTSMLAAATPASAEPNQFIGWRTEASATHPEGWTAKVEVAQTRGQLVNPTTFSGKLEDMNRKRFDYFPQSEDTFVTWRVTVFDGTAKERGHADFTAAAHQRYGTVDEVAYTLEYEPVVTPGVEFMQPGYSSTLYVTIDN